MLIRKCYRYRLYPTKEQAERLQWVLDRCRELYNTALQERRDAYEMARITITRYAQSGELPGVKEDCPEFKQVGSQVLQDVLKRVDLAFQAFFRRVRAGEKPGYPRFKSYHRYDSFTYSQAGWTMSADDGRLVPTGIGALKEVSSALPLRRRALAEPGPGAGGARPWTPRGLLPCPRAHGRPACAGHNR